MKRQQVCGGRAATAHGMHPRRTGTSCERAAATGTGAGSPAGPPAPEVGKPWQEMGLPGGGGCFRKLSCCLRSPPPPHKMSDV